MVDRNFEGEFTTLLRLATELAERNSMAVESDALRHALRELLLAFPVYRTYGTAEGLTAGDITLLNRVVDQVNAREDKPDARALEVIIAILTGNLHESSLDTASLFRTRFQQLTGPLMAKSVEDTLFFRHNLDLALNEVGAILLLAHFLSLVFTRRCAFVLPASPTRCWEHRRTILNAGKMRAPGFTP